MHDALSILVGTVTMRPYVFAFLAAYLFAAIAHLGWKKILAFTVAGYLIAFVSEVSSINNGFPYGWYYYIEATKGRELWVAGVPFFDSLSYVFLSYCSYTLALLAMSPVKGWRWNLVTLETGAIRRSLSVLFLGSLFQVFLDIIIDPVALQGSRWFLGKIYGYNEVGAHYGVPLSNYGGWWLVSILLVGALQQIDLRLGNSAERPAITSCLPFRSLYGPLLYVSVLVFNIGITLYIGEKRMAITGIFTYVLPLSLIVMGIVRRINRYGRNDLAEHLEEFPWSPAGS